MNKKVMLFAGAFTSALLGCATAQQTPPRPAGKLLKPVSTVPGPYPQDRYSAAYCERDRCTITVTVNEKCEITVDPQWMGISPKVAAPILDWSLKAGPGFSFEIYEKPGPEGTVSGGFRFDAATRPDLITAKVLKAKAPAVYNYGIKAKKGGTVCEVLDPPVIVDM
jgi:hypothetical protein